MLNPMITRQLDSRALPYCALPIVNVLPSHTFSKDHSHRLLSCSSTLDDSGASREFGGGIKFVVAKKADSLYKTVSAASIIAKVSVFGIFWRTSFTKNLWRSVLLKL